MDKKKQNKTCIQLSHEPMVLAVVSRGKGQSALHEKGLKKVGKWAKIWEN